MYRKINSTIYHDIKIKQLQLKEKFLYIYLITNNHSHLSGIYYLPFTIISNETLIPIDQLEQSFTILSSAQDARPIRHGLALYNYEYEIVWVINMLKYQGKGLKIIKAVEAHIKTLQECPLIQTFIDHYQSIGWHIDNPLIPLGINHDIPHQYKDKKQNQNQVKDKESEPNQKISQKNFIIESEKEYLNARKNYEDTIS